MEQLQQGLVNFFIETDEYRPFFKRKLYEEAFQNCFAAKKELLASVAAYIEQSAAADEAIDTLAASIPGYAKQKMAEQPQKRRREALAMDYNMSMVTFVLPVLAYKRAEVLDKLADRMVELWNQGSVDMKIGRSTYEDLCAGFKSRLCYITTAICESQNKADDCYELNVLREYRDRYLLSCEAGEEAVREYYDIAPTIVSRINKKKDAKEIYRQIYDSYLSSCISLIEGGQEEKCQEVYTAMVRELQKKYLYS